jgi:hypothetical protein
MSASRAVFLVCTVVVVTLAMPAAQSVPSRPNSIRIIIKANSITVTNGRHDVDPQKVWARAGGPVRFVIENRDTVAQTVRIPIGEFKPKKGYQHEATDVVPFVPNSDAITVRSGKVGVIPFVVMPASHFKFPTRFPWNTDQRHELGMTYKYNVYTTRAGGTEVPHDPDIEIRP